MRLLLDTHIFLWYISADPKLATDIRDAIRDPANDAYLSAASVWEAVIKHGLGKLPLPAPPATYLPQQRQAHHIDTMPVEEEAMRYLARLPLLHRDPFDRILVAQAVQHDFNLVTIDEAVRAYPVPLLPVR